MTKYLIIVADTNDGDYITKISEITDKNLESIKPVIKAINKFKPYEGKSDSMTHTHHHNFSIGEIYRNDLGEKSPKELYVNTGKCYEHALEMFTDDYIPYGENGIHSIVTIDIIEGVKTNLLDK